MENSEDTKCNNHSALNCNGLFAVHTSEILNYVQSFIHNIPAGFYFGMIEKLISKTPHEEGQKISSFFLKLS